MCVRARVVCVCVCVCVRACACVCVNSYAKCTIIVYIFFKVFITEEYYMYIHLCVEGLFS